jgi:hypothetical protein
MTPVQMLARLRESGYAPAVDGEELVLAKSPGDRLDEALGLLHCHLRALLTGRRLIAFDADGKPLGSARDGVIDPAAPLPWNLSLVCVEGLGGWERIDPKARERFAQLFDVVPELAADRKRKAPSAFKRERAK